MEQKYLIFLGIILGSLIVGGCVYLGIINRTFLPSNNYSVLPLQTTQQKSPTQSQEAVSCTATNNTVVTKIIDGDTVVVSGGAHVRLLGIDADEKNYPCYDPAKQRLEELVLGKEIILEKDITDTDKYNRCLRTIFIGSQNIDLQLVEEGLAVARFYPPDVKYKQEILVAEKQAIENKMGCKWAGK